MQAMQNFELIYHVELVTWKIALDTQEALHPSSIAWWYMQLYDMPETEILPICVMPLNWI